eukprot:1501373-Alexandrium_andersonii.AAC.1
MRVLVRPNSKGAAAGAAGRGAPAGWRTPRERGRSSDRPERRRELAESSAKVSRTDAGKFP